MRRNINKHSGLKKKITSSEKHDKSLIHVLAIEWGEQFSLNITNGLKSHSLLLIILFNISICRMFMCYYYSKYFMYKDMNSSMSNCFICVSGIGMIYYT